MKKNRGFSVVELIVSFTLTMVIVVVLFEIIIALKNIYENSVTKSALISKQNNLIDYIYSDINDYGLSYVTACGNNCIQFVYENGKIRDLSWEYEYDAEAEKQSFQKIKYGEYNIELIANSKFDLSLNASMGDTVFKGAKVCYDSRDGVGYISIKIPISNSNFENDDFGLNIFHVFKKESFTVSLPYSNDCLPEPE